MLYWIVCKLARTAVVTGRHGSFFQSLKPEWKSTTFAGDEITFHSLFESLCARWHFSFSLHLALARQSQLPTSVTQTQRVLARMHCCLCFWCLVLCSCMPLAGVYACLSAHSSHFITTRLVWPLECCESAALFWSIKWSWSLKHGEACCIVQR